MLTTYIGGYTHEIEIGIFQYFISYFSGGLF